MQQAIKVIFLSLLFLIPFRGLGGLAMAQGNDPTLAAMILLYTDKAKKEYKQQEQAMLLETTGHVWITEEVNATTDLQKEFNNYSMTSMPLSAMPLRFTASITK